MKWREAKSKKNFCILPFIHAATLTDGEVPLCCVSKSDTQINLNNDTLGRYWNSDYVRGVRLNMLKNSPVEDCRRCYEEEKNGYRSHRVIENKAWEEKLGADALDKIISDVDEEGFTVQGVMSVDLRLGNTCNLQCVMCQPRDSSKWKGVTPSFMKEFSEKKLSSEWREKNNIKAQMFEWYKNENFWDHLKSCLPNLRELIIGGGEPMLIKEHLEFIKYCAESGYSKQIHLRYHTNMTIFPEEMTPYWEKFEKVEFFASIDGMGNVGNYVRYPSQWKDVEENLRKVDQLGDNVWLRLLFSVHVLNVHHFPDFVDWVKNQRFEKEKQFPGIQGFVHPGLVHWPEYLNIKVLPKNYKDHVYQKWCKIEEKFKGESLDKYKGVMQFMKSEDWSEKIPLTIDYIKALDKSRGTNSYSVFPELSEHLLGAL